MIHLEKAGKSEIKAIKKIYKESFPRVERKPFILIERKVREGFAQILSVKSKGVLCGLIITVKYEDLMLIDYFAVNADARGMGIGTQALQKFLELNNEKYRVFLEIEKPDKNDDIKMRRKEFYLRNRLQPSGTDVMLFGVPMELLYATKPVLFEEYYKLYKSVFGSFLARNVKLLKQHTEI